MNTKAKAWLSRNLVGFSLASLFGDCSHEMVPLLLPTLVLHLVGEAAAPTYLGIISGISSACSSITVLFAGWLSDRITHRTALLLIGYALTGTLVGLLGFAHSWIMVLLIVTIAWIGRGLVSAPRNALIADSTDPAYYGHAFGFRQAFDTLGAVLGPVIVYALAAWPVESIFLVALIPGMLAFFAVVTLVREVPRRPAQDAGPKPSITDLPTPFYYFCALMLLFGIGNFNRTLLLLYLQRILGGSMPQAAVLSLLTLLYIFRNAIQTFASFLMGSISDTVGRKIPLALGGFFLFGLMCLLLLWPSTNIAYLILIFFLSGISAGTYTSLEKSFAADLLPMHQRGTGYGLLLTVDSIGDLLSSMIVGFLWALFSPEAGFLYAALLSFLAAALMVFLPQKSLYEQKKEAR